MAKIKCNINEDSTLKRFDALGFGEMFIYDDVPYMVVTKEGKAVCLEDGAIIPFEDTDLVTDVKKAELNLTI